MISDLEFLFQDDSRVQRRVSEGGRGLRPPRHDEKGNDGIENITDFILDLSAEASSLMIISI